MKDCELPYSARLPVSKPSLKQNILPSAVGKTILVRSLFNPTEPGTSPTEVINTTEDITERKQIEEALRASEESPAYF